MTFAAPWLALALVVLPVLWALWSLAARRHRAAVAHFSADGAEPARPERRAGRLAVSASVLLGVLALTGPQWGIRSEAAPRKGRDIIVLLDTSLSMLAEDRAPNRLGHARRAVARLADAVAASGGHRLGLIAFAGRPVLLSPLTLDYDLFRTRLAEVGTGVVDADGSILAAALGLALDRTRELSSGYVDVILVSDGEDHGTDAVRVAADLAAAGATVHTLAVGAPGEGALIPLVAADGTREIVEHDGFPVRSRVDQAHLRDIAMAGGGVSLGPDRGEEALAELLADVIATMPQRELEQVAADVPALRFQLFLIAALIALALDRRGARIGQWGGRGLAAAVLLVLPLSGCDEEDPAAVEVGRANDLVAARAYNQALDRYGKALDLRPGAPVILYDRGTLQLLRHDLAAGIADLEAALAGRDPAMLARAHYNLGVARYRQGIEAMQTFQDALSLTRAAIAHWRASLALVSDQPDARYNIELAYRLVDDINAQHVQGQRNAETRDQKTSDNRGQAFENEEDRSTSDLSDEQAPMAKTEGKEAGRGSAGRQASAAPETVSEMQEAGRRDEMSAEEAEKTMELLRQKAAEARAQHQARQQVRLRDSRPARFW